MKHFTFLTAFFFIGLFSYAQDSSVNLNKYKDFRLPQSKIKKLPFKYFDESRPNNFTLAETILKPGRHILPLDNMPCFVPDISLVSKMPNQQFIGSAVSIPNKITVEAK